MLRIPCCGLREKEKDVSLFKIDLWVVELDTKIDVDVWNFIGSEAMMPFQIQRRHENMWKTPDGKCLSNIKQGQDLMSRLCVSLQALCLRSADRRK
jgi:hypothetical protein